MWTMIQNQNLSRYFDQYPTLIQYFNDIKLRQDGNYTFFPRRFYYTFPSPLLIMHVDRGWVPQHIPELQFSNSESLRPRQVPICRQFEQIINSRDFGGIIKARPGAGKTIMAVYIACQVQRKTIIILDNNKLVEQWTEAILKFATLNQKPLTMDNIGIIQGTDFTTTDNTPFTIAMVQTLMSRNKRGMREFYTKIQQCGFDLVFYDECHKTTCGPKFATASLFFNTKNLIGLSATPYADNLSEVLLTNTIGDILVEDREYDLIPSYTFVYYNSELDRKYLRQVLGIPDLIRRRGKYNSIIKHSTPFKVAVTNLIKDLLSRGHRVIFITFTKEMVLQMSKFLEDNGIKNTRLYSKEPDIDKQNDMVICATLRYAGAGFDYEQLSAAIIGTPLSGRKSLIQLVGRIVRSSAGKINPEVYDMIDTGFNGIFLQDISKKKSIIGSEFGSEFRDMYLGEA